MKRFNSIDVMRASAIIFMVMCHFVIYLSHPEGDCQWIYLFANHLIGDFAAPIFVFLAGMSQAVSLSAQGPSQKFFDARGIRMLKRGLLIILVGFILSILTFGPFALFEWDILPFIGVSIMILFLLRKAPLWTLVFLAFLAVFITPFLRELSGYSNYWGSLQDAAGTTQVFPGFLLDPVAEYRMNFVFTDVAKGLFINGYFPVFPWIAFPLIGYFVGKIDLTGEPIGRFDGKVGILGLVSITLGFCGLFYAVSLGYHDPTTKHIAPFSFYPASTTLLLVQMGICFVFFYICRKLFDKDRQENFFIRYCRLFSKYSLTIYVVHYLLLLWPLWLAGFLAGDLQKYYNNALSAPQALGTSVILLILFYYLLSWWNQKQGKYSFEWFLAKLTPKKS